METTDTVEVRYYPFGKDSFLIRRKVVGIEPNTGRLVIEYDEKKEMIFYFSTSAIPFVVEVVGKNDIL